MIVLRGLKVWALILMLASTCLWGGAQELNSEKLGFDLALPGTWFEVPAGQVEQLGLGRSAVFATDDAGEQCVLVVSREPLSGRTMRAFILASVYSIYNEMKGFVLHEEDVTVAGKEGYRLVYEAPANDGDTYRRYLRILVIRNDFLYTFQTSTSRKEFAGREGTVLGLVNGVSWSNDDKGN